MKLLLLTDCPPCLDYTGGIYLDCLMRFLPRGSVVCFAVTNRTLPLEMRLTPDLDWIPIEYAVKPDESSDWRGFEPSTADPEIRAQIKAREDIRRKIEVPALVERAVAFGRMHGVDAVFAVLEGQTMIRMALPVAEGLGAPLYSLIWDPLSWWLLANKVDPENSRIALAQFDETVRRSRACAVASWVMAEEYQSRYQVRCVPLVQAQPADVAQSPDPALRTATDLVLGMAGQFYAASEWENLVEALDAVGWTIAGRQVRVLVLGRSRPVREVSPERLDFRGWKEQAEVVRILSEEADVLYCPYPFAPELEEVARYSFPSKLTLYFAAGRPVIFHGPDYSSPARYLGRFEAAMLCVDPGGAGVVDAMARCAGDPDLYRLLAHRARERFVAHFTNERICSSFYEFLGFSNAPSALAALTPAPAYDAAGQDRVVMPQTSGPDGGPVGPADAQRAHAEEERLAALRARDAGLLHVAELERALEVSRLRVVHEQRTAAELRGERDQLAVRLALALDRMRSTAATRDHFGRHIVALEQLLAETREREQLLAAAANAPEAETAPERRAARDREQALLKRVGELEAAIEAERSEARGREQALLERVGCLESAMAEGGAQTAALVAENARLVDTLAAAVERETCHLKRISTLESNSLPQFKEYEKQIARLIVTEERLQIELGSARQQLAVARTSVAALEEEVAGLTELMRAPAA